MQYFAWGVQTLILTAGIHVFLRFVRTTRGNPLIRGLLLSVLVGVVGLWGVASVFQFEELQHILEGSTGFIVIGLAIVFQPELRRAIAQLGERAFAKRTRESSADAIRQVVAAARNMAARRDGALIAFERESSLRTVVETGSTIGARVNARLLESLFHPGGALHDGAVVIREDRVIAAGCFLPLSRNERLDLSKGTRHRAALGLAEESDAVIVVVSEETGTISIAREGRLTSDIAIDRLEAELRTYLETTGAGPSRGGPGYLALALQALRRDFGWITASALLACGAMFTAHQSIREPAQFQVQIVDQSAVGGRRTPEAGEILVLPPAGNVRVRTTSERGKVSITVSGSKGQLQELGGRLRGTLEIGDPDLEGWIDVADGKIRPLDIADIRWEDRVPGLEYRWTSGTSPELKAHVSGTKRLSFQWSHVALDTTRVDARFEARREEITFEPDPNIEITGPAHIVNRLTADPANQDPERIQLAFDPIELDPSDIGRVSERLRLHKSLRDMNLSITEGRIVRAVVPVLPYRIDLNTVRKDIALVCLSPEHQDRLALWRVPANAQLARIEIVTAGLIPADWDVGSPAYVERKTLITRFVEDSLRVFVDVAELPPPDEGRSARVHLAWLKDWREYPEALGLEPDTLGDWEELSVRLASDESVLLEPAKRVQGDESP